MKNIFIMKTRNIVISVLTLLLCTMGVVPSQSRSFEKGERLYINGTPDALKDWGTKWKDDCELWCKLINGSSNYWVKVSGWYTSTVYYIEIPEGAAGEWYKIRLARYASNSNPGYNESGGQYNITGEIDFYDYKKNYIQNFAYGDGWREADWRIIAPTPTGNPETDWTMAYEDERICTSAADKIYILAPTDYDYNNSYCHAWFKYHADGNYWERIWGYDYRAEEGEQDNTVTLGAANSDTYYFYQAAKPSRCRLLRIRVDQDCNPGADGACEITSFAAVASDANVTDSTCSIDGLVAFDDTTGFGNLVVWCDNIDTATFYAGSIEIPQKFKLTGFDARSSRNYEIKVKFEGSTSPKCSTSRMVSVAPPSSEPIVHDETGSTGSEHERSLTHFVDENITLYPSTNSDEYSGFVWINSENDDRITSVDPGVTGPNLTFTSSEVKDVTYTFIATKDPIVEANLISTGGTFEEYTVGTPEFSSAYDYWGKGDDLEGISPDFYEKYYIESGYTKRASGGFVLCRNSKNFSNSYYEVTPHQGNYFGLFDSKVCSPSDPDQVAWSVSGLSVQKGTSYLFSFWVANINNPSDFKNGAKLQFQISYDNGVNFKDLGSEIDLSTRKDNNWHGESAIETPNDTYNSCVTIRVVNKNKSSHSRGNDFGLDAIRFEAITTRSSNVAAYEVFPVKFVECEITGATFEQMQADICGATSATVDYRVDFVNPRGDLYIYEGTTELAHIAHDDLTDDTYHEGTLTRPLDGAEHTLTVYFKDANGFRTDAPETYKYTAHTIPAISVKSLKWNTPSCDVPTCTLTAEIYYTNQNGTLSANVDGGTAVTPVTYNVEKDAKDSVIIEIPGVVADGKTGHKLNVSFGGSHGCSISDYAITTAAPYSPQIKSTTYAIQDYKCGDENYKVEITVNFANGQGKDLTITDGTAAHTKVLNPAADAPSASWTFDMPWEDPVTSHTFKAYFDGKESCKDLAAHKATYTAPIKPFLNVEKAEVVPPACNSDKYSIKLKYSYRVFKGSTITYSIKIGSTTTSIGTKAVAAGTDVVNVEETITSDALICNGGDHLFTLSTGNAKDCEYSKTLTAPLGNTITKFAVAPIQPDCGVKTYNLRATWTVTKPDGGEYDVLVIKVGTATREITIDGENATGDKAKFDIPITYTIGDAHPTIKAYMKERGESCEFTPRATYSDPTMPSMAIGTPWFEDIACNEPTFTLIVPDTFVYQRGDMRMWLDSATYDKAKTGQKITITDGNWCGGITTGDKYAINSTSKLVTLFKFTGLSLTGTHKIFAECTGDHSCHLIPAGYAGKSFIAPTLPTAAVKEGSIKYTDPKCDVETVTLKFTINYVDQSGTLKVWVDGIEKQTYLYTGTTGSVNIEYPNVPADGLTTHKLNFEFEGSCSVTNIPLSPAPPRWPVIKSVTVTPKKTNVACNENEYTASIKVDYVNIASTDRLVVQYTNAKDGTLTKKIDKVLTGTTTTFDFPLNDIGEGSKELYVYLDGAADCKTTAQHKGAYTAPYRPELIINSVDTLHDACSASTYSIAIDWKYRAFKASTMKFYVDGAEKATSRAITYNATEFTPCKDTIKGLTADGGLHTLKLLTDEADNCTKSWPNIRATKGNTITSFRIDTTVLKCGDDKYKLVASWEVPAATSYDTLIIVNAANEVLWKDSLKSTTYTDVLLDKEYNVGDVTTPTPIYAYLKERGRSACDKSDTYVSPVTPKLEPLTSHVITDSADCSKSTYSLIVPVTYTNQHGKMHVWLDADSYAAASYKVEVTSSTGFDGSDGYMEGAAERTTRAKLTDLPGDGAEHKVSIAFDDERGCTKKDAITYEAPFRPVINSVEATPTTPADGVLAYDVEVVVTTTNGKGKDVTIKCADLGLEAFGNVGDDGIFSKTFKGLTTDNGVSHTFKAYFNDRQNCVEEGSFTSPDQRKFHSFNVVDTLLPACDNSSFVVFEVTSTAMEGNLVIKDNNTGEELYRHATPIADVLRDTIKHSSRVADGASHTLLASFTAPLPVQSLTDTYTARPMPTISMVAKTASAPDCNGTVHLPLQVTFANQTAALVVRDNAGNVIDSIPAASVGASPRTITWSYPADENSATLKAYAYFSDRPECATPMVDAEAKLAQSWGYTSHYSPIACDGSYADTLRFTWSHASSDLYIDSIGDPKQYTGSGESGTKTLILHGNVTDVPKDVYKVYFAANVGICDSIIRTIVPQASVLTGFSANVPEVSCGATEYTINATWTYAKAVDSLYIAEEGVGIIWRDSAKAAQPAIITRTLDLDNPGKAHQLYAYFRDKGTACKSEVVTIHEPIVPSFKVTRMEYTRPSCGADKDTLLVDLQYIRQEGTMQVWVDGGSKQTFSGITKSDAAQQQNNIRIEDVPADGLTHTLHVTFTTGCTTFETETPIAPVTPNMTIGSEEITAATGCADSTYTLVVPVTYTNQRGDMFAWIDNNTRRHKITANEDGTGEAYLADQSAERTTNIKFSNLVADGKQHTIHIACDETQGACAKTKTYDAPFTPVIDSVVVSCNEPAFGATTYDATVKVYYKNASKNGTASSLTIRSTDLGAGQSQRTTSVPVSGDGVYTWEVTGLTAEKGATRHFEAFFVDRDTCVFNEEVQTPDTRKLIFSVTPSVVNCDGKDTILFTVNASDLSGNLVVMEGATELYNQPAPTAYPYNGKIETLVDAGTSHTLTAYFTSDEDLTVTKDFTAPAAPTIKMTKADTYNVDCGGEVTVELTIEYENQTGGLEVHDNTGAEIYRKAHNELPASPITFNWTYPADGDTYTATAYFTDRPQCPVAVTADVVSEPYRTHAHHTSAPDCDGYYNDTIRFKWGGNDAGTFVIDSINGTTVRTFTDVSGTFDKILRGHVTDIPSDRYVIYYAGQDCQATVQNNVPKASVLTAFTQDTAYAAGCDATTYALEVSWEYTLAEDELLIVDAATNDVIWQHKATDLPTSATITGLPFDATVAGKEHTLYAYFRDRGEACKREVTYKEPEKPALSITGEVSFSGQSCTGETVDISFPLTYTQQNGTVEAWIDGMDPVTVGSAQNETWTPATEQFTLYAVPADGRTTDLHVRINGTTGCIADKSGVVIPQQPIIRTITTDQPKAFVSCGEAYDVTVSVTFEHGNGKYIAVKYTDEGTNHVVQTSSAVTDGTPALITLSGLKDAGAANRSISVYFIDYENCAIDTAAYSLPALNSITAVTVQPGASACGELDYSVSGHVEFNNADGELIVKYDDSHVATISNQTATSADFIIENMNAEGTDLQLTAYFSNAPACAVQSETFDAPSVPTLSAEILVVDTVFACGDKRYDVTISIAADNQTGDYIVTDSIDGGTARPFTSLTQFSINRPAASETHIISVRYPATGCEVVIPTPLIVSPLVPAMGEAVLAQSQPECGETDYTLSLSFSHTNMNLLPAADRMLVITDNGTELYNDTIPATVAMTFELPALGDAHTVQITCGLCSATYNYVAPKPYECARYDTLICITEHYAAHGFDITPDRTMTDSLFTRWNGHGTDSLFLTVKEQPAIKLADVSRICDSERELAFPYSVLSGVIDSVQLTLTNAGGADVIADEPIRVTDDTLYYNLSSSLPAGDYLTSVEVFTRGIACSSSASTPLTIAKDSVIYSKWTDVLLVDNTDGLYTAYQWYENGSPISGQTGQTLYMPEGMTGTYYCRMTTAEGDIYTCEYVFDEIPRSADHQQTTNHISVKPNRVKAGGMVSVQQSEQETLRLILLSATGQRIAEYTQTESEQVIAMPGLQGIYLLRIASENDAQTVKIVVY